VDPLSETTTFTNVVIFIRFSDEPTYTAPYSLSYYEDMFNGVDTVSLRDYYLDVSYNQMTIDSYIITSNDQIVYFTDIYKRGYYQPYSLTNPQGYETDNERNTREQTLLKRAIDFVEDNNLVPDDINLDANNDGAIDSISFLISGEADDWNELLWPHKWELYQYYNYTVERFDANAPTINGKNAFYYTFEMLGNFRNYEYAVDVSILAHETFHLFYAPDLYHYYDYFWIEPVGHWGLMENLTDVPSHMLGYMKYQYGGWIDTVDEITNNGSYTLYPMQDSADNLYRIDTGYSNEYIYLEYRDQTGRYEGNVPDSGLIVYRVDLDYMTDGNELGYYSSSGSPRNEVFIFRPGLMDTTPPITFPNTDQSGIDEDGMIDQAALSQYNNYDEMGLDTDIIMFHSDGSLMNITIYNVVEHDGYITFDVQFEAPDIVISTDFSIPSWDDLVLLDVDGTSYEAIFTGVREDYDIYYTLDGTEPTLSSTRYQGEQIIVTSDNPQVRAIIVDGMTVVESVERTFTFSSNLVTTHSPYGDNQLIYWLLDFQYRTEYDIYFNQYFELNGPEDRFWIYDSNTSFDIYTDTELSDTTLSFTNDDAVFVFFSDDSDSDAYGFNGSFTVHQTFPVLGYTINGNQSMEVTTGGTYTELGINITGDETDTVYYITTGSVDTSTNGVYQITYTIYDGNDLYVDTLVRTVTVGDFTAPVITLEGEDVIYLDVFDTYVELGASVTDNISTNLEVVITGSVKTSHLGIYTIYYSATDEAGNSSEIIERTVIVEDHIPPTIVLNPGVDTIYQGEEYTDPGAVANDNYYNFASIEVFENNIDTSISGSYYIIYLATDESGNETFYYRYVNVIAQDDLVIECDPGITTYHVGDILVPLNCMLNDQEATLDTSEVDINTPGTYPVTYSIELDDTIYEYHSFVFVLGDMTFNEDAVIEKKEDDQL
jgi:M6 family metalloprotease-like protein